MTPAITHRKDNGAPLPVLLIAPVPIESEMLGPGIRYWEFARLLSRQQKVTLLTFNPDPWPSDQFPVKYFGNEQGLKETLATHPIVVIQGYPLFHAPVIREHLKDPHHFIAVDLYTPLDLEGLEIRPLTDETALDWNLVDSHVLREQLKIGDYFFCASERQRDYWLGMLSAMGRLNPPNYRVDRTGRRLIDVLAFGLSSEPPVFHRPVLKGVHPQIASTDRVFLWFGGLWNWLDPLTVIRAFADFSRQRTGIKLVFVTKLPQNYEDPETKMIKQAIQLSRDLGLYQDKIIFAPPIPYAYRESLLLEADFGLCFHPDHLETRFSFRTRLLDYIWAGLPIITGAGDVLGELVQKEGLGLAVNPGDEKGWYQALVQLAAEPNPRRQREQAFTAVRDQMTWETVASPLLEYCRDPWQAADRGMAFYDPFRSADLEKMVCENIHQKYQIKMFEKQIEEILDRRVLRLVKPFERILSKFPGLVRRKAKRGNFHS